MWSATGIESKKKRRNKRNEHEMADIKRNDCRRSVVCVSSWTQITKNVTDVKCYLIIQTSNETTERIKENPQPFLLRLISSRFFDFFQVNVNAHKRRKNWRKLVVVPAKENTNKMYEINFGVAREVPFSSLVFFFCLRRFYRSDR